MYNSRITEVHQNVKFLFSRVTFLWPTILVLTRFLREKRLSNAQGRGLCEANAGHAPRAMVSWGRGIVGDAIKSWCDRPDDRFWAVSHGRCPVVKAYSFICIHYLCTVCINPDTGYIYMYLVTFNRPCEAARQIGDGVLYLWKMPNKIFCKFTFFHADTKTDHKSQIQW